MACGVALKRPYDYDEYLSAEGAGEAKRARHTQAHCSPFRAQIGTIAASLPVGSSSSSALLQLRDTKREPTQTELNLTCSSNFDIARSAWPSVLGLFLQIDEREDNDVSPFASIAGRSQLSSGQLESYLRAEIRYLKRRHLIPHRKLSDSTSRDEIGVMAGDNDGSPPAKQIVLSGVRAGGIKPADTTAYRVAPNSPAANSGSDSDGESSTTVTESTSSQKIAASLNLYDRPQFSLKQVQMICERLLKQQEVRLRYEYETVLNQRLEEQHEQYVQFAREQLERQHQDNNADISYLS
uniref:Akirin n=1 Tax=Ascaris lumbricoides TaxID=6252 RepID=A0A9J2Q101_ASCLU